MDGEHTHPELSAELTGLSGSLHAELEGLRQQIRGLQAGVDLGMDGVRGELDGIHDQLLVHSDEMRALKVRLDTLEAGPAPEPAPVPAPSPVLAPGPGVGPMADRFGGYVGGTRGGDWVHNTNARVGLGVYAARWMAGGKDNPIGTHLSVSKAYRANIIAHPEQVPWFNVYPFDTSPTAYGRIIDTSVYPWKINPSAQMEMYQRVLSGSLDEKIALFGEYYTELLDWVPAVAFSPTPEGGGSWKPHAAVAGAEAEYKAFYQRIVQVIFENVPADKHDRLWDDWSLASGSNSGGDPALYYPGDDVNPATGRLFVTTHSLNNYLYGFQAADHVRPGGPFGVADITNTIVADRVRPVLEGRWNAERWFGPQWVCDFATAKGRPLGIGEGAPRNKASAAAPGDTGLVGTVWADLIHENIVNGPGLWALCPFHTNAGGVRTRFADDCVATWAAFTDRVKELS